MSKRSPGPWYVAPEKGIGVGGIPVSVVVDALEQPVVNCGSGELGEANAVLVSLAPGLLSIVRAAYAEVDTPASEWHSQWVRDAGVLLGYLGELP